MFMRSIFFTCFQRVFSAKMNQLSYLRIEPKANACYLKLTLLDFILEDSLFCHQDHLQVNGNETIFKPNKNDLGKQIDYRISLLWMKTWRPKNILKLKTFLYQTRTKKQEESSQGNFKQFHSKMKKARGLCSADSSRRSWAEATMRIWFLPDWRRRRRGISGSKRKRTAMGCRFQLRFGRIN